jgi:hypothetical protein
MCIVRRCLLLGNEFVCWAIHRFGMLRAFRNSNTHGSVLQAPIANFRPLQNVAENELSRGIIRRQKTNKNKKQKLTNTHTHIFDMQKI